MNKQFLKYKPSAAILEKGILLEPIISTSGWKSSIEMEEHSAKINLSLISGALLGVMTLLGIISILLSKDFDSSNFISVGILLFVSTYLIYTGVNEIKSPRSKLTIDQNKILFYNSIDSSTTIINWTEVKDISIKSYGSDSWLLIQNEKNEIVSLEVSSLYKKGEKEISSNIMKDLFIENQPNYSELRKVIGQNLNR